MKAISREALQKLNLHTGGMEFASEMLIEVAKKGLVFEEIPITYYPRKGPSKLHNFADGWRHIRFIMLVRPLRFYKVKDPKNEIMVFFLITNEKIDAIAAQNKERNLFSSIQDPGLFPSTGSGFPPV